MQGTSRTAQPVSRIPQLRMTHPWTCIRTAQLTTPPHEQFAPRSWKNSTSSERTNWKKETANAVKEETSCQMLPVVTAQVGLFDLTLSP